MNHVVPYRTFEGGFNDKCVICLDPLENGLIAHERGGERHPIHEICISEWLKDNSDCPSCRIEIDLMSVGVVRQKVSRVFLIFQQTLSYSDPRKIILYCNFLCLPAPICYAIFDLGSLRNEAIGLLCFGIINKSTEYVLTHLTEQLNNFNISVPSRSLTISKVISAASFVLNLISLWRSLTLESPTNEMLISQITRIASIANGFSAAMTNFFSLLGISRER